MYFQPPLPPHIRAPFSHSASASSELVKAKVVPGSRLHSAGFAVRRDDANLKITSMCYLQQRSLLVLNNRSFP